MSRHCGEDEYAPTGLVLHHSFKKKDKKEKHNNRETYYEFGGDPLEDCQCEHKYENHRDKSWYEIAKPSSTLLAHGTCRQAGLTLNKNYKNSNTTTFY